MHRVTPFGQAYECDGEGFGPFAIFDELQQKTVDSNIKVLDLSPYIDKFGDCGAQLPKDPKAVYSVKMQPTHSPTISTDKFIILNDTLYREGKYAEFLSQINQITAAFVVAAYTQPTPAPLTMGEWTLLWESQVNYVLPPEYTDLTRDDLLNISVDSSSDSVDIVLPNFTHEASMLRSLFPAETEVEINSIGESEDADIFSKTTARVVYNQADQLHHLIFEWNKSIASLAGRDIPVDITISSKYGPLYRYGTHYIWNGGIYVPELVNRLHFNIN